MPVVSLALLAAVALAAAIFDFKTRKIPNWLNLAAFVLGFALNYVLYETPGLRFAGLGALLAFGIYLPLYLLRGMGAGDVKLMTALGAIAGPANWMVLFLLTALCGGIFALALIQRHGRTAVTIQNMRHLLGNLLRLKAPFADFPELDIRSPQSLRLPHGVAIGVGTFLTIFILSSTKI